LTVDVIANRRQQENVNNRDAPSRINALTDLDRTKRVKDARNEAQKEIEEYRKEKESEYQKFEKEVRGPR
jgi:vacuolar-type H+-ATPase subunit H